ncbi:probable protein phosphatase 2C 15 isoform X1 [Setaria viridis]|nr:probable protein phosphatase 2C 15 isoform X1 [Setaria viridis]
MSSRSGSVGGGSSAGGSSAGGGAAVPLAVLLRREVASERTASERPELHSGLFSQAKKGEDFTFLKPDCERLPGVPSSSFSAFGLFDGHNGNGAAIYTKENLLNNILSAVPADLNREDWLAALPRALVAAFVKTDKDFQTKARSSGTTVTFVIIDGLVITVASVGDSRCVLEAEGSIYHLSSDHRFDASKEEVDRVTESGGDVGRLNVVGGAEIGPLRCWPGGLCLSRSIGDQDVGQFIVPVPLVKQVKLSTAGGRLIIASDGVWDALSPEAAFNCSRELPPEPAAEQIVKTAVHSKGLRDDTTCIVVDIVAEKNNSSMPLPKKQQGIGVFKNMFCKKKSSDSSSHADREYMDPDIVEEMFEDGCALLSRRLDSEYPVRNMFKLFICAICQVELKPNQGISVHEDSSQPGSLRRWDGPFLCQSCQEKKEAMEGKHRSRDSSRNSGSGE